MGLDGLTEKVLSRGRDRAYRHCPMRGANAQFIRGTKMTVRLWKSSDVTVFCNQLKEQGYKVIRDTAAGTVKCFNNDDVVFQAIKKGVSNAWICRINDAYIEK